MLLGNLAQRDGFARAGAREQELLTKAMRRWRGWAVALPGDTHMAGLCLTRSAQFDPIRH
ncbi:hypothetical protein ABH944_006057 [Caballeronia udeis]|uniref:Uncharacterized protein n=1 Tax=Caballeronia udeis TaxID=1232866 RepID=A0ABW8MQ94_9BURK